MLWLAAFAIAGTQRVTVVIEALAPGVEILATHDGRTVPLVDPGRGLPQVTFDGPPARFFQLRLDARGKGGERPIYDGMIALADADKETLTFAFEEASAARRVAASPSAEVPYLRDDSAARTVATVWGGLTLGWVAAMGIAWARKR